jgi:phenylpropionate dioxygenase-like ring-hydroxylating dioxygenase large terminal subunit
MNDYSLKDSWFPIVTSQQIPVGKILSRKFQGIPLVIFRNATGNVAALEDRCPHRFAPLSAGTLKCGEIICPYHGWRFNTLGQCTHVPGLQQVSSTKPLVTSYHICESFGLVWINCSQKNNTLLPAGPAHGEPDVDIFFITDHVKSIPGAIAENFLDGFHTHFVHAGWIRKDQQRQTISAHIHHLSDGIEVIYRGEGVQSGVISRWLEGERGISMGRFRLPGLAEIEYRDPAGKLTLLVSLWLTPEDEQNTLIHARIATPQRWLPAWIKKMFLKRLFNIILRQDKNILEATMKNQLLFEKRGLDTTPLSTTNDLLSPYITKLLETGSIGDVELTRLINL